MTTKTQVFTPRNNTVNIAVTTASQVLVTAAAQAYTGSEVRLANVGTATVFVNFSTGTASPSADIPLLPNSVESFAVYHPFVLSCIGSAAGSTLYVTLGEGA